MQEVFISHSSIDKAVADAICAHLEQNKIRCWIAPRDILPGQAYAESIINAIKTSRIMIVVFSNNSNSSRQVAIELERAIHYGVIIIPFRIENITPEGAMEYYLSSPHWLDAMNPPLESHINRLVVTVKSLNGVYNDQENTGEIEAESSNKLNNDKCNMGPEEFSQTTLKLKMMTEQIKDLLNLNIKGITTDINQVMVNYFKELNTNIYKWIEDYKQLIPFSPINLQKSASGFYDKMTIDVKERIISSNKSWVSNSFHTKISKDIRNMLTSIEENLGSFFMDLDKITDNKDTNNYKCLTSWQRITGFNDRIISVDKEGASLCEVDKITNYYSAEVIRKVELCFYLNLITVLNIPPVVEISKLLIFRTYDRPLQNVLKDKLSYKVSDEINKVKDKLSKEIEDCVAAIINNIYKDIIDSMENELNILQRVD